MKKLAALLLAITLAGGTLLAENEILLVGTSLTTTSIGGSIYATVTLAVGNAQNDIETYVEENKMLVARDMSKADGESLEVISDMLSIEEGMRTDFYTALQSNYSEIFPTDSADSKLVSEKVVDIASSYL
jgi:hypothetical protein